MAATFFENDQQKLKDEKLENVNGEAINKNIPPLNQYSNDDEILTGSEHDGSVINGGTMIHAPTLGPFHSDSEG